VPAGKLQIQYFVTRAAADEQVQPGDVAVLRRRISRDDLAAALQRLNQKVSSNLQNVSGVGEVIACLCGPPAMVDDLSQTLRSLHVVEANIRSEKWW
jgi:NAD(P)H-flavin reductase